jgi:hypothetical protein
MTGNHENVFHFVHGCSYRGDFQGSDARQMPDKEEAG